ncbi:MAG TPA: integration host factor, actinobacterial type [Nitriliruptoraceae bacterium]|nr:integration host factor, actinobacterial type [Nitriliruptoraceae bacterium]
MAVPERTSAQRSAALAQAQRVRQVQAQVKQMLKTGEISLADVLARADRSDEIARLRVARVLESMPRVGPVTARRMMERLDIAASRRVGGLGPRQRDALLAEFA